MAARGLQEWQLAFQHHTFQRAPPILAALDEHLCSFQHGVESVATLRLAIALPHRGNFSLYCAASNNRIFRGQPPSRIFQRRFTCGRWVAADCVDELILPFSRQEPSPCARRALRCFAASPPALVQS